MMAFCMNCGHELMLNARFCDQCGTAVGSYNPVTSITPNQNTEQALSDIQPSDKPLDPKDQYTIGELNSENQEKTNTQYSIYEVFDYSNSNWKKVTEVHRSMSDTLAELMYKNRPDLLNNYKDRVNNPSHKTIYRYIITNSSIILDGTEYTCEHLKIICPDKSGALIKIKINDVQYELWDSSEDKIRLYYSLMMLNQNIKVDTLREKLQYIWMGYCLLNKIKSVISKQPSIIYDNDNETYDELWTGYQSAYKYENDQINSYYKELITKHNYISKIVNTFFKEENPITNDGYNRHPETLAKVIDIMTDFDTDMNEVINRYNRKVELEKQQEAEYLERKRMEREMSGSSGEFLSRTLSTAAGVAIGNKISNRKNTKKDTSSKAYYTCPIGCKYGYRRCGVPE